VGLERKRIKAARPALMEKTETRRQNRGVSGWVPAKRPCPRARACRRKHMQPASNWRMVGGFVIISGAGYPLEQSPQNFNERVGERCENCERPFEIFLS